MCLLPDETCSRGEMKGQHALHSTPGFLKEQVTLPRVPVRPDLQTFEPTKAAAPNLVPTQPAPTQEE